MSTFAVFGMTRSHARGIAKKKTRTITEGGHLLSEIEWMQRVAGETEAIMRGKSIRQLSPKFDAPQFADQFIAMAMREQSRDLQVRAYRQAKDAAGKPIYVGKSRKLKMEWAPYSSTRAAA